MKNNKKCKNKYKQILIAVFSVIIICVVVLGAGYMYIRANIYKKTEPLTSEHLQAPVKTKEETIGYTEAVTGFSALDQLQSGKAISCVFNFEDGKFPLIAYLDENYFKCNQENFVGESYMVCKVLRKIPKGKSIKLDEIFDDIKKISMNRQQRRKMPKNMDNPEVLRDVIKGPALVVVPIAVYQ